MFNYTFQQSKKVIFEVRYDDLDGHNKKPDFATSAAVFNQPKTDFNICGQCQEDVLNGQARAFWKKWDKKHLCYLTQAEEREVLADIETLKATYNWIEGGNFYKQKELSKMQPKKIK